MKIKAKKGCVNSSCTMCQKKEHAHKDDLFCPKCGETLSFVCEKCHTVLEDGSEKLCIMCQAEKDDTKEKRKKSFVKAGSVVLGVVTTGATIAGLVKKKK